MEELTFEQLGRKQSQETRKKIAKAQKGSNNSNYVNGRRSYREKVGAKPGQLVHHVDHNRNNNSRSNLMIISKRNKGKHDKLHKRQNNFFR